MSADLEADIKESDRAQGLRVRPARARGRGARTGSRRRRPPRGLKARAAWSLASRDPSSAPLPRSSGSF
jgi:hypothetical protein